MSTSWGGLSADRLPLADSSSGTAEISERDRDDSGAWSEDLDLRFYADTSMTLPGQGERPESCGTYYPKEFCDECGEPRFGMSRCETRKCPSCWGGWSRRRAERITRRLAAARHVEEPGISRRVVHAVVSAPEGSIRTLTDVQQGYRDAYGLAKERGVRGGVVVFHGYRVTDAAEQRWRAARERDEFDRGKWKWVREEEDDWRAATYWSPHWHVLGLSEEFEADEGSESEQWRVRRIRSLEAFSLHDEEGYADMAGTAMYLLSHASFEADTSKDCVRWFGSLATTAFSPEEELSEGALSVVERYAEEAAAAPAARGESVPEEEEEPCEECGSGSFSPIWDAGAALADQGWCERIGREQQQRLAAAFEWAIGERHPPPGLRHPRSEEEAREAFEAVL